jgi:hypothetical protein
MSNKDITLNADERRGKTRAQTQGFVAAIIMFGLMAGPLADRLQRGMVTAAVTPLSTWSQSLDRSGETDMAGWNLRLSDGA